MKILPSEVFYLTNNLVIITSSDNKGNTDHISLILHCFNHKYTHLKHLIVNTELNHVNILFCQGIAVNNDFITVTNNHL